MTNRPTPPPGEFLYLLAGDADEFVATCADLLPADIAESLNDLPPDGAARVLTALPFHLAVQVLDESMLEPRDEVIERLPDAVAAPLVHALSADQQVRLFRLIKEGDRARLLHVLDAGTREQLARLLSYPPQSAGGLMTTEYLGIPSSWTALDVRQHIARVGRAKETVYAVYIIDEATQRLARVTSLREVIIADSRTPVMEIGEGRKPVSVRPLTDREEVARLIARYNLLAIPVLDDDGRVLGTVTVDDVIDALISEQTEDVQKFGGMAAVEEPYLDAGFWQLVYKRAGWLCVLFLGKMLNATAMGRSDHRDVLLDPLEPGEASARSRAEPKDVDDEPLAMNEPREPRISIPAAAGRRSTPGAPELVDTRVDCMIRIESIEPLEVQRLWTAQRETLKDLSRSLRWFGFDDAGNLWRPLTAHSAGCFHWYCAAMQMVDRRGAISERDFNIFATGVHRVADQFLAVTADVPSSAAALGAANEVDRFCASVDVQVGVNIVSEGPPFAGTKVRALAEASGMVLGDDGAFHAQDDEGRVPRRISCQLVFVAGTTRRLFAPALRGTDVA